MFISGWTESESGAGRVWASSDSNRQRLNLNSTWKFIQLPYSVAQLGSERFRLPISRQAPWFQVGTLSGCSLTWRPPGSVDLDHCEYIDTHWYALTCTHWSSLTIIDDHWGPLMPMQLLPVHLCGTPRWSAENGWNDSEMGIHGRPVRRNRRGLGDPLMYVVDHCCSCFGLFIRIVTPQWNPPTPKCSSISS